MLLFIQIVMVKDTLYIKNLPWNSLSVRLLFKEINKGILLSVNRLYY